MPWSQNNPVAGYQQYPTPYNTGPMIAPNGMWAYNAGGVSIWGHPAEGVGPLAGVPPYNEFPNNRMHPHNNGANWGTNYPNRTPSGRVPTSSMPSSSMPSSSIPTSQPPSAAGIPAFRSDFPSNQYRQIQPGRVPHGQIRGGHMQVRRGQTHHNWRQRLHRQGQQVNAQSGNIEQEPGQFRPSTPGPSQPVAGAAGVNINQVQPSPAQGPEHDGMDAIEARFLRALRRRHRELQLGPGDIVNEVWFCWMLEQSRQGRNGVEVRSKSSSAQDFEAVTLTILNDSSQAQARMPEQTTQQTRLATTSYLSWHTSPARHSPKKRSVIALPSTMNALLRTFSNSNKSKFIFQRCVYLV